MEIFQDHFKSYLNLDDQIHIQARRHDHEFPSLTLYYYHLKAVPCWDPPS